MSKKCVEQRLFMLLEGLSVKQLSDNIQKKKPPLFLVVARTLMGHYIHPVYFPAKSTPTLYCKFFVYLSIRMFCAKERDGNRETFNFDNCCPIQTCTSVPYPRTKKAYIFKLQVLFYKTIFGTTFISDGNDGKNPNLNLENWATLGRKWVFCKCRWAQTQALIFLPRASIPMIRIFQCNSNLK